MELDDARQRLLQGQDGGDLNQQELFHYSSTSSGDFITFGLTVNTTPSVCKGGTELP